MYSDIKDVISGPHVILGRGNAYRSLSHEEINALVHELAVAVHEHGAITTEITCSNCAYGLVPSFMVQPQQKSRICPSCGGRGMITMVMHKADIFLAEMIETGRATPPVLGYAAKILKGEAL